MKTTCLAKEVIYLQCAMHVSAGSVIAILCSLRSDHPDKQISAKIECFLLVRRSRQKSQHEFIDSTTS